MEVLKGVAFGVAYAAVIAVAFWCILAFATRITYGFTFGEQIRGWVARPSPACSFPYVQRPWRFGPPIAVFWYGSSTKQEWALARQMCQRRSVLYGSKDLECLRGLSSGVVRAAVNGRNIWPNRTCAVVCGDPDGWWPGRDAEVPV